MAKIPKRRDTRPLESKVESDAVKYARATGWQARKYTSPSHRSVPDRLFLHDFGTIIFIEFKRLGEQATAAQKIEHAELRARGFTVYVIDTVEDAKRALDKWNPYNNEND